MIRYSGNFLKCFVIPLFLLLFCFSAYGFSGNIDSLRYLLENAKEDTQKCYLLSAIAQEYLGLNDDSTKYLAEQSLELAQKINFKKGIAENFIIIGKVFRRKGDYAEDVKNCFKALAIYEEMELKTGLSSAYIELGNVYYLQNNFDEAISYYEKFLEIEKTAGNKSRISAGLSNLGSCYAGKGDYDKHLQLQLEALKIEQESGNDIEAIAANLINVGASYYHLKNYPKSIEYFQKAQKEFAKLNDRMTQSTLLVNIGTIYLDEKKYSDALKYFNEALAVACQQNYRDMIKTIYENIAVCCSNQKNYQQAYEYQLVASQMKDTLFNEESSNQIAEMQTKYETEKKVKEIQIANLKLNEQEAQIKAQRITIFSSVGGVILLLALAIVALRAYRNKQKANTLLKEQKKVIEEKNRDITSSIEYAKRIQEAVLPVRQKIYEALPHSFIFYQPKDIVSGDFYWFCKTSGDAPVFIAAADCTGHGVPGAFMSMIGSSLLNKIVLEKNIFCPAEILNNLNTEIKFSLKQTEHIESTRDGMDIALCKLTKNGETHHLEFSGANRQLILFENGNMKEITPDKRSIGGLTEVKYSFAKHKIPLQKETMIYLFSDGFADQFGGPKGKKFMIKNLKELFFTIKNLPLEEQEKTLRDVFNSWKGNQEQIDDVLVIGMKL